VPPVRLFIGNLPYQATEDDLRSHFAQVGQPTQIVRPLDRETGRARGFAFVEYADRETAENAIRQFDGQLFMGRPLAVSEARAREDRGPGGPARPPGPGGPPRPGGYAPRPVPTGPSGGFSGPRPAGGGFSGPRPGGGFGGPRPGGFGSPRPGGAGEGTGPGRGGRDFGPPAPPKGKGPKKPYQQKERAPKGPIPTKFTGRMYDLDDVEKDDDIKDELPEFMKPEDGDAGEPPEADAADTDAADALVDESIDRDDEDDDGRDDR
jgi:cold-inducible RNA-binding protein